MSDLSTDAGGDAGNTGGTPAPADTGDAAAIAAAALASEGGESGDGTSDGDSGAEAPDSGSSGNTVPDVYADYSLPEGVSIEEGVLGEANDYFKSNSLTQEQAQRGIDLVSKVLQKNVDDQAGAFEQLKQDWRQTSEADPSFGRDKYDENIGLAQSAMEKLGTPELNKLLVDTGIGNHPEMVRLMVSVGGLLKEDNPGGGSPTKPGQDRASILYPSS